MQTTYTSEPAVAFPGMPADSGFKDDISTIVEETGGIEPGLVVVRGTGGDNTARLPPATAADLDSIKTNIASTAGVQNFTVADFNGAIGDDRIYPPAKISLVLSSHADWNATNATIVYEDQDGVRQTETLAIPDNGNATVTTTGYASRVISLSIPAQAGAGGTATLGTSASVTIGGADVLGVSIRTHHARRDSGVADTEVYEDETTMPVRRKGRVWVTVENAFEAGDRVFVRTVAGVGEQLGALRTDTDAGDAVPWTGGRLMSSGSAGDLGILEVNVL